MATHTGWKPSLAAALGAVGTRLSSITNQVSANASAVAEANAKALVKTGTITLPEQPVIGESVTVLADATTVMPVGVVWDKTGVPVVTGRALVSFVWTGGEWLGTAGTPFAASATPPPDPNDGTAPAWVATLTVGNPLATRVVVTASALAMDASGPVTYEVSYAGEWNPIVPSGFNFTLSGSEGVTYTNTQLRARDANGNVSAHLTVPSYTMSSNLSAAITALSPVGYWKLNEKGGSVASDYSGNNRPGAYVGGYELNADNGYVDLNGGYVEIPDADDFSIPTGNGVTVFALLSPREAQSTSRRFIISKGVGPADYEWHFEIFGDTRQIGADALSGQGVVTGRWSADHVVTTGWQAVCAAIPNGPRDADVPLYRNSGNKLSSMMTGTTAVFYPYNGPATVRIGGRQDYGSGVDASFAHVAIFPGVLTGTQVGALMAAARADGLIP